MYNKTTLPIALLLPGCDRSACMTCVYALRPRHQVLDTNVVLNQMDLLDHPSPALSCVIVLQTVMQVGRFALSGSQSMLVDSPLMPAFVEGPPRQVDHATTHKSNVDAVNHMFEAICQRAANTKYGPLLSTIST